jgi:hypothetical protein
VPAAQVKQLISDFASGIGRYWPIGVNSEFVMRGLDPRIHLFARKLRKWMDCRVKPGNDGLMSIRA